MKSWLYSFIVSDRVMTAFRRGLGTHDLFISRDNKQMFCSRAMHDFRVYPSVESHETAAIAHCRRKKISVGQLSVPQQLGPVENTFFEQVQICRPELVVLTFSRFRQACCDLSGREVPG
ncbi:hypothetical protein [Methylococcus sp. EFPC2]|uniref:hypothetical protein n=1 Tax=Methylococcus sp. EFPC2 TaxID=2812648 RepID=UPI001967D42F|nr:hypothetical protein [Methylococcus sp. EFPC2]QSA96947.1 hypothetical protein JWZ97_17360 [Methylococcus sp. EFPC2]